MNRRALRRGAIPAVALALALTGCGGQDGAATAGESTEGAAAGSEVSGEVIVDGSSTVQPLTAAAGELYAEEAPGVNVSVATSGTGGGFEKFCQGQTDISNASRAIEPDEIAICEQNGIAYTELQVAADALTVVASTDNEFLDCLTTAELKTLWAPEAEGAITTWNQVNPEFPNEPIELYGPGTDSGTFDYFTDAINGEEGASRSDYNASEDDNTIVQGVGGSASALGYFGFSYFEENTDTLKAVEVDGGGGCVAPSADTAQDGTYTPLARPLFIYVSHKAAADKPQVAGFVEFYAQNSADIAEAAQFIPLNEEQTAQLQEAASALTAG